MSGINRVSVLAASLAAAMSSAQVAGAKAMTMNLHPGDIAPPRVIGIRSSSMTRAGGRLAIRGMNAAQVKRLARKRRNVLRARGHHRQAVR